MQLGWVWNLCADPGVGCGAPQNLGLSVQSLHCGRIGPCADLARCFLTNLRRDRAADGSDLRPARESQLWRCDGGDKNPVQAFHLHQNPDHQTCVESAEVRQNARRDRHNHLAGLRLQRDLRLQVRHQNRPSVWPVPLKSPEGARSRRQKTRWFQPIKIAQTGELDQASSPGRKEFLRRASRSPRRTRRNHGRERA